MKTVFDQLYSRKVWKHIRNPQNMGELKNPDGVATVGNPVCGDIMKIYIKVGKRKTNNEEYLQDVKFQTLGCGAAIATSSMITVMTKGKSLSQVKKITKQTLVDALGGLPVVKIHCSVLASDALKKAIENYKAKLRYKMRD
ncbi:MAG: iron-sulfur cluster assembly scaffold protein [Patescibacteria group bacterium]